MGALQIAVGVGLVLLFTGCGAQNQFTYNDVNWDAFNCRRYPAPIGCSGNGICNTDGSCDCTPSGNQGYDCSLSPAAVPQLISNCPSECNNNGVCYRDGIDDVCLCDPQYVGDLCETFRLNLECLDQTALITTYVQRSSVPFSGTLFVQLAGNGDPVDDISCQFPSSAAFFNPTLQRYVTVISTENITANPCLPGLQFQTTNDGELQACYDIRVQYSSLFRSATDERFRHCCTESATLGGVGVTVLDGSDTGGPTEVNGSVSVIEGSFIYTADGSDVPAGTLLRLGELITLVVDIPAGSRYDDFRVDSCTAQPNDIPLVTNRCRDPGAVGLVNDIVKMGTAVHVELTVWDPVLTNQITITCETTPCLTPTSCEAPTSCPFSNIMNLGRKKREAEKNPEEEVVIVTQAFYVGRPGDAERLRNLGSCPVQESCPSTDLQNVFIPVSVVFGVLLLVALAISVFLCIRYRKPNQSENTAQPSAYFNPAMSKA